MIARMIARICGQTIPKKATEMDEAEEEIMRIARARRLHRQDDQPWPTVGPSLTNRVAEDRNVRFTGGREMHTVAGIGVVSARACLDGWFDIHGVPLA